MAKAKRSTSGKASRSLAENANGGAASAQKVASPGVVTPWNKRKLSDYDVRKFVPPSVVETIERPHDHEGGGNRPLWIIWQHVEGFPPIVDTICDTADSAVYHYGMLAQEISINADGRKRRQMPPQTITPYVERIPANHRFASSLNNFFDDPAWRVAGAKAPKKSRNQYQYARVGD